MLTTSQLLVLFVTLVVEVSAQVRYLKPNNTDKRTGPRVVGLDNNNREIQSGSDDLGKAVFIKEDAVQNGEFQLYCYSEMEIKHRIYWKKNGVRIDAKTVDEDKRFRQIYTVTNTEEALYECNGVKLHLVRPRPVVESRQTAVWKGTVVRCIDDTSKGEVMRLRKKDVAGYETVVYAWIGWERPIWNIKGHKIDANTQITCNHTKKFVFNAQPVPSTTVTFKKKQVICESTDVLGRCTLNIYLGNSLKASGPSPTVTYKYGKINIQQVKCNSTCMVDGDVKVLPVTEIEINRTIYIVVIFFIILIIFIIIVILCCVLWHKFGFKEKYGYKINMRLKKSFDVDNKFSSYRLSGVEADAAYDSDPDETKEFKDMDEGGSIVDDDSFVDPNFAKTNMKQDMRSKDDIHNSSVQRPFIRI